MGHRSVVLLSGGNAPPSTKEKELGLASGKMRSTGQVVHIGLAMVGGCLEIRCRSRKSMFTYDISDFGDNSSPSWLCLLGYFLHRLSVTMSRAVAVASSWIPDRWRSLRTIDCCARDCS
jgi:hypothetical protein